MDDLVERVRRAVASQPFMTTLGVTRRSRRARERSTSSSRSTSGSRSSTASCTRARSRPCSTAPAATRPTRRPSGEVDVLTVEYKINLLEPAVGERVIARGRVVRRGGRLTVCHGRGVCGRDADRDEHDDDGRAAAMTPGPVQLRARRRRGAGSGAARAALLRPERRGSRPDLRRGRRRAARWAGLLRPRGVARATACSCSSARRPTGSR